MKFYRGEVISSHPKFPNGSAAETRSSAMPVEIAAPDIVYTKEDDEAIDRHNRQTGEPALCFPIFCQFGLDLILHFFQLVGPSILYVGWYFNIYYSLNASLQSGTCAMKPRDQGGVVDERLNVYGVKNLKVAGMELLSLVFRTTQY